MNRRSIALALALICLLVPAGCARNSPPAADDSVLVMIDGKAFVIPRDPGAQPGIAPHKGIPLDPRRHKRLNVPPEYRDRYPTPVIDPPGTFPMQLVRPDDSVEYTMPIIEDGPTDPVIRVVPEAGRENSKRRRILIRKAHKGSQGTEK